MKLWFPIFGEGVLCKKWMVNCNTSHAEALKVAKKFYENLGPDSKPHYYPSTDWIGGVSDVQLIDTRKEIIKL